MIMKRLFTPDDVINEQFYKMPRRFFSHPKYMPMRCESKLAYMLIQDLLPLSVQNGWVNENNEVYVKLSRTKLMDLLHIKGTQKAAQVMKELVDYGLIVNKRVGLTRCNEIYVYVTETPQPPQKGPKDHEPNNAQDQASEPSEPANSQPRTSLEEDIEEVNEILESQIHIEDLKQKYDPDFVEEIGYNIREMFLNESTRIGHQNKPMVIMRSVIRKLKMHHIEHVIDQFRQVSAKSEIVNPKGYIQTMIYNSLYEANSRTLNHIRYNFGYC